MPVAPPHIRPDCASIYNQYTIRLHERDGLIAHLKANDIGCEIYYPQPLHLQECFQRLGYKAGDLLEAERASREVVAIPVYPELTSEMREHVIRTILSFVGAGPFSERQIVAGPRP
jgi:dTDP-4-amino-4,6-dideoxygalactose transaminase